MKYFLFLLLGFTLLMIYSCCKAASECSKKEEQNYKK
jgi:hypothetical protein